MPRLKFLGERHALRHLIDDVTLNKAFKLAHSIYRFRDRDRETALNILWEALRGVEVRLIAQGESDRHDPLNPTKVRWGAAQWFQLLIYCKSEWHEKQQESNDRNSLSEGDMVIRYIKYLILITCRRNSFHVSLGLSRLLYNYSAAETMSIYDLIFQDPDNSTRKADAYYRARKNKLIDELKKRFQQFVKTFQGPRGELRFHTQSNSDQLTKLVAQYLRRFTPWETNCEIPEHLDAWTQIHYLQSRQVSQIHSVIHPACFSSITKALKLASPESRLAVPRFFMTEDQGEGTFPPGDSSQELTPDEAGAIRARLAEQKEQRKKFIPRSLSVRGDGVELARLDLAQSGQIRFEAEEDTTLLELVGSDEQDELLLATHILTYEEDDPAEKQSKAYSIVLEGGQQISLTISPEWGADGDVTKVSANLRYRATGPARAVALWWRRLNHRVSESRSLERRRNIPVLTPKIALALVALIAAGLPLLMFLRSGPTETEQLAKQQQPAPIEGGKTSIPGPESSPQITSEPEPTPPTPNPEPPTRPSVTRPPNRGPKSNGTTRAQSESAIKSLLSVKQVYVESLGDDTFGRTVRQKLIEKLQADSRFVVAAGPDEAEAAITGSARLEGKRRDKDSDQEIDVGSLALEIVNVNGEVIWHARKYQGTAEEVAAQFAEELVEAIHREERRLPKH